MEISSSKNNPNIKRRPRHSITSKLNIRSEFNIKRRSSRVRKKSLVFTQEVTPIQVLFKNDPDTLKLIELIKLYNELKSKKDINYTSYDQDEINPKFILKNIVKNLKLHKGLYNFFSYYKINDDKILSKLPPFLQFFHFEKNRCIWEENDNSDKIYYLLKGKLSFKKNAGTILEKEKYKLNENNIFGMLDILYERKRKLSCLCLSECCCLCFEKEFFKKYMEEKVNKIEAEKKSFLVKFFNSYITIPLIKLERFILNHVEMLFFGKNDIIYREGDKNQCLYLIFNGEANLLKNINKGEFFILSKFNQSINRLKERAKNIDYINIIKSEENENSQKILEKDKNMKNLELLLDKTNHRIMSTLSRGSIGGLEITSGTTKFKYSLISNSSFCSVIKINLEFLDEEHLKMLMVNLLPIFIKSEKQIHLQIKNIKYIDHHIIPPSCRKYNDISNLIKNNNNNTLENESLSDTDNKPKINIKTSINLNLSLNDNENDKTYQGMIQKIDDNFDTNEGGFIKMNNFNLSLCKQKYYIKEQLKDNKRKDIKIFKFIKKYEKDHMNDLKCSTVKMNYLLSDENIKSKKDNMIELILLKHKNKINKKSKSKSELKIWKFPSMKNKLTHRNTSMYYMNFKINKKNKNKKIKSSKITKKEYFTRINEIFQNYYNKVYLKKDYSKKEDEEDHRLISIRLLKDYGQLKLNTKKENPLQRNGDFIKEIIVMKGKAYKDEGTNTYDLSDRNNNIETLNSFNNFSTIYKDKKCLTQFNSINEFNNILRKESDKNSEKVIKIVNNNYIRDLFYKNSYCNNLNYIDYNNKFRNTRKKIFNEIENKKFGNFHKNRMIFYDTGRFDMPLASVLSKNEY